MNLVQFFERWPAKQARVFFFAGKPDADRLSAHILVCDLWRKQVDKLDFVSIHQPSITQLLEAARSDPLKSRYRVIAAQDVKWDDPDEIEDPQAKLKARRTWDSLASLLDNLPRDLVLIISTPAENPSTQGTSALVAQQIIKKGYWVVLKQVDHETACRLLTHITGWTDEQIISDVVGAVGTSPSSLIQFLKLFRTSGLQPSRENLDQYLSAVRPDTGVFELVDAIIMKDLERALSLTTEIPTGQLIGATDRKLTSLLQFMGELKKGYSPKEAMLALRLPGFIVHGLFEASKRWYSSEILAAFPTLAAHTEHSNMPGANEVLIADLIG